MRNQQQVANSIKSCNSISELYQIMIQNTEFIHHCYQDYIDAVRRLPVEFHANLILYLCEHYVKCSDITQDYSLLETYMTKLVTETDSIDYMDDSDYAKQYLIYSLAMVFCPKEKLSEKATERSIAIMIQAIENCYIPNDISFTIPYTTYLDIVESKIILDDITKMNNLDVMIPLYKYIVDLHGNVNTKMNFIRDVYATYRVLLRDQTDDELNKKFVDYFGEDVEYIRSTVYASFDTFVQNAGPLENKNAVAWFFDEFRKHFHYEIIPEIQDCLVNSDKVAMNLQIISSLIFEVFSDIKKQYGITKGVELLGEFLNEYLPTFNYTGPTITAQESLMDYLAEEANKPVLTKKNEKAKEKFERRKKMSLAYRNYTEKRDSVDEQLTKMLNKAKNIFTGDVRTELIEGKEFSALGLLKKVLGTAAVFSFGKVKGFLFLVVRRALNKKTKISERKKIVAEIEIELSMIDEKIQDAANDGNREAKYALMRTKAELQNALKKIKYGIEADRTSVKNTSKLLNSAKNDNV